MTSEDGMTKARVAELIANLHDLQEQLKIAETIEPEHPMFDQYISADRKSTRLNSSHT